MATDLEVMNPEDIIFHEKVKNSKTPGETPMSFSGSALDWYKLTETSRHVLSQVVSGSINAQLHELSKPNPNPDKIKELEEISLEALKLSRDSKNFKSKERMLKIIANYSNFLF